MVWDPCIIHDIEKSLELIDGHDKSSNKLNMDGHIIKIINNMFIPLSRRYGSSTIFPIFVKSLRPTMPNPVSPIIIVQENLLTCLILF